LPKSRMELHWGHAGRVLALAKERGTGLVGLARVLLWFRRMGLQTGGPRRRSVWIRDLRWLVLNRLR